MESVALQKYRGGGGQGASVCVGEGRRKFPVLKCSIVLFLPSLSSVLRYGAGEHGTCNLSVSTSQLLGWQVCISKSAIVFFYLWTEQRYFLLLYTVV